jgi:hypothetical protein
MKDVARDLFVCLAANAVTHGVARRLVTAQRQEASHVSPVLRGP